MIPKKPAPDLIRGGNRFSEKIMRKAKICEAKEEIMAAQSYDRLEGVIWYDGKMVPWADANLHVLSHGLHYASAVFEGERAYGGAIFKSTEHAGRLARLRNDGRLGAEQHHPPRHRQLGMAELFRSRAAAQGHPARSCRIS